MDNAQAIVRDLELHGDQVWQRFNVTDPTDQVRYYQALARRFRERKGGSPRVRELEHAVERMRVLSNVSEEDAAGDL